MGPADVSAEGDMGGSWGRLTPLRITLVYLLFGFGALYVSDFLFIQHLTDPVLSQVQALKGGVEVLLTGFLIFVLTRRSQRQLRRANDRLGKQRDELQFLHRVLRHNLRNDITTVHGYLDLIRENPSADQTRRRCNRVIEAVGKMERYIEGARMIRAVTDKDSRRWRLDLAEILPRAISTHSLGDRADVERNIPDRAGVEANPMLEEALGELLENAVEHNDADSPTVRVAVDPGRGADGTTTVRIEDNGPGIPESEIKALDEGNGDPLLHSSGIGLWFVDWVVTHSGGKLELTTGDHGGTRVRIRLPTGETRNGGPYRYQSG